MKNFGSFLWPVKEKKGDPISKKNQSTLQCIMKMLWLNSWVGLILFFPILVGMPKHGEY